MLCPLIAAGVVYIISSSMQPVYQAKLTLVVDQSQGSETAYNDILAAERRARTFSRLVTTRDVLDETIQRLGLPYTSTELADRVAVQLIPDTQLLNLTVLDESPTRSASIANTIAQVFIETNRDQYLTIAGSSRDEVQSSIDEVKQRIDNTSARIADLQGSADKDSTATQTELTDLQTLLSQDQATYSSLLEARQRMALAEAQAATQVRIADAAVPPSTFVSPRVKLNTAVAAVLGFGFAALLVALVSYLDNTVKSRDDVERVTGKVVLGAIPQLRMSGGIQALLDSRSIGTEAFRGLRTNLQFALAAHPARSVVVTSAGPMEGKTTTAVNLAAVLAQGGQRVILVDADLRRASVHNLIPGLTNRIGLTNVLLDSGPASPIPALQSTPVPGLRVLATGPLPPNPPDVLGSPRMHDLIARLEEDADIVLIDVPPLLVSDPLIVAGLADAVLLLARSGQTRPPDLGRSMYELTRSGTPLLGIILNHVQRQDGAYDPYYSQYLADAVDVVDRRPARHSKPMAGWRSRSKLRFGRTVAFDHATKESGE